MLGTLIGIGALLILPKIVSAFGGHQSGSGGYYRSEFNNLYANITFSLSFCRR